MNAIEIRNLSKSFRGMYVVDHLNMTVSGVYRTILLRFFIKILKK